MRPPLPSILSASRCRVFVASQKAHSREPCQVVTAALVHSLERETPVASSDVPPSRLTAFVSIRPDLFKSHHASEPTVSASPECRRWRRAAQSTHLVPKLRHALELKQHERLERRKRAARLLAAGWVGHDRPGDDHRPGQAGDTRRPVSLGENEKREKSRRTHPIGTKRRACDSMTRSRIRPASVWRSAAVELSPRTSMRSTSCQHGARRLRQLQASPNALEGRKHSLRASDTKAGRRGQFSAPGAG